MPFDAKKYSSILCIPKEVRSVDPCHGINISNDAISQISMLYIAVLKGWTINDGLDGKPSMPPDYEFDSIERDITFNSLYSFFPNDIPLPQNMQVSNYCNLYSIIGLKPDSFIEFTDNLYLTNPNPTWDNQLIVALQNQPKSVISSVMFFMIQVLTKVLG